MTTLRCLETATCMSASRNAEILKGVNLVAPKGEVHAIKGRNGSGKSTLSYVSAGKEALARGDGRRSVARWRRLQHLRDMEPSERAVAGLFLAFSTPHRNPGVATMTFLRRRSTPPARRARAKSRPPTSCAAGSRPASAQHRRRHAEAGAERRLGGEKKRAEILQMAPLKPKMAVLDEDRFRLDIRCAAGGCRRASTRCATVHARCWSSLTISGLLNHIVPDVVHVFSDGQSRRVRPQRNWHLLEAAGQRLARQGQVRQPPFVSARPRPSWIEQRTRSVLAPKPERLPLAPAQRRGASRPSMATDLQSSCWAALCRSWRRSGLAASEITISPPAMSVAGAFQPPASPTATRRSTARRRAASSAAPPRAAR